MPGPRQTEEPRDGTKRRSFVTAKDGTRMPESLTRGERSLNNKPIGAEGSSKSAAPKKGGDAARKAQEWGGGSKGAKEHTDE